MRLFLVGAAVVATLAAGIFLGVGSMANDDGNASNAENRAKIEALYEEYRGGDLAGIPSLSVDDVLKRQSAGERIVFVDVREDVERAVSIIPGAITADDLAADPEAYRDAVIVPYCTIGYRSGLYTKTLRAEGWDAVNLEGSILAWTHAGQQLEGPTGETKRVHVYGPRWSLAADGYEPVW